MCDATEQPLHRGSLLGRPAGFLRRQGPAAHFFCMAMATFPSLMAAADRLNGWRSVEPKAANGPSEPAMVTAQPAAIAEKRKRGRPPGSKNNKGKSHGVAW
jgi:hypothetical protein